MTPIIQYLEDGVLSKDKKKTRLLRLKVVRYTMYDGRLYKRGFSTDLLKCVDLEKGNYILQEIHEGICDNHAGGVVPGIQGPEVGIFLGDDEN